MLYTNRTIGDQNLHIIENKSTHYFYRKSHFQAVQSVNSPKARFLVSTI